MKRVFFSLLSKDRVKSHRNKCIRKACEWYHRCNIYPLGAVEVFVRVLLWNLIEICYLEEPQRKHEKTFKSMWVISTCVPVLLLSREDLNFLIVTWSCFKINFYIFWVWLKYYIKFKTLTKICFPLWKKCIYFCQWNKLALFFRADGFIVLLNKIRNMGFAKRDQGLRAYESFRSSWEVRTHSKVFCLSSLSQTRCPQRQVFSCMYRSSLIMVG